MKYLKLFENHSDSYEKIGYGEFLDMLPIGYHNTNSPDGYIKFTNDEFNKISKVAKYTDKFKDKSIFVEQTDMDNKLRIVIHKTLFSKEAITKVQIFQISDEWFLIDFDGYWIKGPWRSEYYKCDQFDGLLNCISSILKRLKNW